MGHEGMRTQRCLDGCSVMYLQLPQKTYAPLVVSPQHQGVKSPVSEVLPGHHYWRPLWLCAALCSAGGEDRLTTS